jgi:hypothetical protein
MPPWSGMAKELRRLAKAAKLDPDREDAEFIAEIIESPALGKAAGEFWRAYQEPITALGKATPAARGALLNLFPTGSSYNTDLDEIWLDLLEATGATESLIANTAPVEAQPSGGRAAWFDKLTSHLARSWRSSQISARVRFGCGAWRRCSSPTASRSRARAVATGSISIRGARAGARRAGRRTCGASAHRCGEWRGSGAARARPRSGAYGGASDDRPLARRVGRERDRRRAVRHDVAR